MDKKQFKEFCKKEFELQGFTKQKSMFYLCGKDLLCGLDIQKSNYGSFFYVNYHFFIGDFHNSHDYPERYDFDVEGRILAMSKTQTIKGKHFKTAMIEYEKYTEEELLPYFEKYFQETILPPIKFGKKYILDNLGKVYFLTLRQDEVMEKLKA